MFPRLIWGLILLGVGAPFPAPGQDPGQDEDEDEILDECAASAAFLDGPSGVAVDGAGNVYVADLDGDRIRKVDAITKRMTAVAGSARSGFDGDGGPAVEARLKSPGGVAVDALGNIYIADTDNDRIRKVDAAAQTIATLAGSGEFCFNPSGVCGERGNALRAVLHSPSGVALDAQSDIYIADTDNHRIRMVYPHPSSPQRNRIVTIAGNAAAWGGAGGYGGDGGEALAAQLNQPQGVAAGRRGAVYIADTGNHRIRKIYPDPDNPQRNLIDTIAGTGIPGSGGDGGEALAAQLNAPQGVAVDYTGVVYIADTGNHRIRKIYPDPNNPQRNLIDAIAGTGGAGYGGDGGEALAAQLNQPADVALDDAGNLYVADRGNRRIRRIDKNTGEIDTIAGRGDRPRGAQTAPEVCASPVEISFALPQDAEPASRTVVLYVARGAADFQLRAGPRWITAAPASGRLAEDEEASVEITVDPVGLRVGTHSDRVYVRSAEGVATLVAVVLEVLPPLGPAVSEHGVVNAAAMSAFGRPGPFGPAALPAAPGSMVAVLGENFTAGGTIDAAGFPLPTSLGGVRVRFEALGGAPGGLEAKLFSVGPQRIEAQLPSALGIEALDAGGIATASVVVRTAEGSSYRRSFSVASHAPGIFTASGEGTGQAAVLFAGTTALAAPRGYAPQSRPAQAGDVVEIYATGLGAVYPPIADGENSCAPQGVCRADASNLTLRRTVERPQVRIGGVDVGEESVLFSGLAPALAAVNVVVVEVPQWLLPSDRARVSVSVGGRTSQLGVTMAVE